jgi:hypothetical protein
MLEIAVYMRKHCIFNFICDQTYDNNNDYITDCLINGIDEFLPGDEYLNDWHSTLKDTIVENISELKNILPKTTNDVGTIGTEVKIDDKFWFKITVWRNNVEWLL